MRWAIIVCAGQSQRFGKDKLAGDILGRSVTQRSVDAFCGIADRIIVVYGEHNQEQLRNDISSAVTFIKGGATRAESVTNALAICEGGVTAIHDGARPFCSRRLVEQVYLHAEQNRSAVPYIPPIDAVTYDDRRVKKESIRLIQTPQAFDTEQLKQAYAIHPTGFDDESALWEKTQGSVCYIAGEQYNKKITYPCDLPHMSIGYGYDLHRLVPNRRLILGGVEIEYNLGLLGHSDADVVIHSLMDALLSAMGKKDIGHYFPPNCDKYKDAYSMDLLATVVGIMRQEHYYCDSISVAIIAERPRLAPYLEQMRQSIATALDIQTQRVGITVTTAEGIGEIGQGEAIACRAVVILTHID